VISRVLGPADRGVYYLVLGVAMLVVSVGGLGFGAASCYTLLRRGSDVAAVHANALVAAAAVGLAVLGLYALAGPALHRSVLRGVAPAFVWTGLTLVPPFVYTGFWTAIMSARGRFDLVSRYEIAASLVGVALTALALLVFRLGAGELLAVTAATHATFAVARVHALRALPPPWKTFDPALFVESFGFGLRGHPGHLALYACLRADVFIVNLVVGAAGVGHYTLAASIAERVWRIPGTPRSADGSATPRPGSPPACCATPFFSRAGSPSRWRPWASGRSPWSTGASSRPRSRRC
jgi:O-antigen/teichoic acid export membrane protein